MEKAKTQKSPDRTTKKTRKLIFDEKAFNHLLSEKKIKAYVILLQDNLAFECTIDNGNYIFTKNKPQGSVYRLRTSTLPKQMLPAFERMYPALATEKREFYFVPSTKINTEISAIKNSDNYGVFKITADEEILHYE